MHYILLKLHIVSTSASVTLACDNSPREELILAHDTKITRSESSSSITSILRNKILAISSQSSKHAPRP